MAHSAHDLVLGVMVKDQLLVRLPDPEKIGIWRDELAETMPGQLATRGASAIYAGDVQTQKAGLVLEIPCRQRFAGTLASAKWLLRAQRGPFIP